MCPARHWLSLPLWCPAGGLLCLPYAYHAFSFPSCPLSPRPRSQSALPRRGRGSPKVYFAGGFAPGTPALDRSRHLQTFPNRSPGQRGVRGWSPEWQEMLFFGQCRQPRRGGTRGRWNYPSHATAAFEMVLSPGAGRASAANDLMQGCRGRSPRRNKQKKLPLPRRGRGVGG